jgi:hypothetical protein
MRSVSSSRRIIAAVDPSDLAYKQAPVCHHSVAYVTYFYIHNSILFLQRHL